MWLDSYRREGGKWNYGLVIHSRFGGVLLLRGTGSIVEAGAGWAVGGQKACEGSWGVVVRTGMFALGGPGGGRRGFFHWKRLGILSGRQLVGRGSIPALVSLMFMRHVGS